MTDTQKTTITEYVTTLNSNIEEGDLLDLVVNTVNDRVLLYLNDTVVDDKMLTVIAQIVVNAYKQANADTSLDATQSVSHVTDNGQSMTLRNAPVQYMATATDQELFSGFTSLLSVYRRPHVIAS